MAIVSPYLSIIKCEETKFSYQRHTVAEWIKKTRPNYMLPTRDSTSTLQTQAERDGVGKDI